MHVPIRSWSVLACAVAMLIIASSAAAQIEDQVSEYVEANAEGYLQPLADAIGADLNSGVWRSAYVPEQGLYIALDLALMATFFDDDHRTFTYTPGEGDNDPVDGADLEVPTIVGDTEGGTIPTGVPPEIVFVPGFDINSFALAAPQIRIGAFKGTEAIIRWLPLGDVSDVEIGDMSLLGIGGRHSISQWMNPGFPVDISAGFLWQSLKMGDDLIDAQAMTFGVQVGKRVPLGFALIEPYGCISYDTFKMDVSYEFDDGALEEETINLEMESDAAVRVALGLHAQTVVRPPLDSHEVLVMVMAAGVNYNGVWAALGLPISPFDVHKQPFHVVKFYDQFI